MVTAQTRGAREGLAERVGSAVEVASNKRPSLVQLIQRQEQEVERALPVHLKSSAAAYVRAAISLVKQTPKLAQCDPLTVLGGLMTASQLGLELGPLQHAYLVPYGRQAQLIIGYRGMIDLAWRSGKLASIEAREVCENDDFEFSYGLDGNLKHTPSLGDRGPTIAYYGVARFKDGGYYYLVMSRSDIDKHRARSRSKDNGPWVTDYDAMARKTVIRAMAPFLPLTTEVMREMAMDGVVTTGTTADDLDVAEVDYIDVPDIDDPADTAPTYPDEAAAQEGT